MEVIHVVPDFSACYVISSPKLDLCMYVNISLINFFTLPLDLYIFRLNK